MGINLEISQNFKTINVNGKEIRVPKLGLRHRLVLEPGQSHEDSLKALLKTVSPNLSLAERDVLTLHILAYNERMPNKIIVDDFEYDLDNVYICQKLKFQFNDFEFKFRSPTMELLKGPADILLKTCCVYVKKGDQKIDIPDFMDMPAFVMNWVEQITKTVAIDGPNGPIKGLYEIAELFSGPRSS